MNRNQLAVIHVAKKQVGMTEEEYQDLLGSVGVTSSKELDKKGFSIIMNHFEQLGFKTTSRRRANHAPEDRRRYLDKIDAILASIGQERSYADAIAQKRFGVEQCHWLPENNLRSLMQMLIYHQKRKEARKHA